MRLGFLDPLERCSLQLERASCRSPDHRRHAPAQHALDLRRGCGLPRRARASMDAATASRGEVTRLSLQPGIGSAYLLGTEQIIRLRATWQAASGPENTDLRAFHDRLLAYGSIPVAMAGRAMFPSEIGGLRRWPCWRYGTCKPTSGLPTAWCAPWSDVSFQVEAGEMVGLVANPAVGSRSRRSRSCACRPKPASAGGAIPFDGRDRSCPCRARDAPGSRPE